MGICRISLSFDDGRLDNYVNAFPVLKKYSIKGTFHVVTGYIDNSIRLNDVGSSEKACTIDELIEMKNYGCEISSHSNDHSINDDSVKISLTKLKKWGFTENIGFSIPHSDEKVYNSSFFKSLIKNKNISYVRTGKNLDKLSFFRKVCYVLYNLTKFNIFYYWYNYINVNHLDDYDRYKLISIPVKSNDELDSIKYFIDKYADKNIWIIFMFHSIVKNKTCVDKWDYPLSNFEEFCKYLFSLNKDKKIIVDTIINIVGDNSEIYTS